MADETPHGDGQYEQVKGDGVQPADLGHAEPDTGQGDSADSEIPIGVDSLTDEQIQKAQEAGPAGGGEGEGEGDEGGGGDAIDVAAIMEDGGADASGDADADASGDDDADASGDADAAGDDEADASGDADADASLGESETEGNAADDAGDDAAEKTEPEAQVAPDTGDA
jgi:hypothetical protein